jgi:RNA polymerase sigma-70 factor (ECF subfamily)
VSTPSDDRLVAFEGCRRDLVSLAYRMLGDMGRAEDMAQETWLRWSRTTDRPDSPRAYLVTIITRLCLNELDSARMRREESRADRLPEPVAMDDTTVERLEELDQVSMALLVVLQQLKPTERAVLLLHDVFDFDHASISALVGKSAPACRKLLERARQRVAEERRTMTASREEHARLLQAFLAAAGAGDTSALLEMLAEDAVMISDGGEGGAAIGGFRNLQRPLVGRARIAAFVTSTARRSRGELRTEVRQLNGRLAVVFVRGDAPFGALQLAVAEGRIQRLFFHADAERLRYLTR